MSWNDKLKALFPYGPDAWDELRSAIDKFCGNVSRCDDSCPLGAERVEFGKVLSAIPDVKFSGEPQLPLCNKFATFVRPEETAAIVGYVLPERSDSIDPFPPDCDINFSGLFLAE
jgi:hypothetical protein